MLIPRVPLSINFSQKTQGRDLLGGPYSLSTSRPISTGHSLDTGQIHHITLTKPTVATPMTGDKASYSRIVLIWYDSPTAWGKQTEELSADPECAAIRKEHREKWYTAQGTFGVRLYRVAD